jgi:hypothetical protein
MDLEKLGGVESWSDFVDLQAGVFTWQLINW